ncbi:MAG: hypothetical protein BWY11_01282 [Firmicutes bacterium ADurb.Bin182]|nr:MAG: hypothetical protein BWY11_01282 [Firmicutes bacterium ADurb.Bin182]
MAESDSGTSKAGSGKRCSGGGSNSAEALIKRALVYICGSFILAMGIAFTVKADLGLSPVNTLPFVVSRVSGADFGLMVTLFYSSFVLVQIAVLGKEFQLKNLLQIIVSVIFGNFVSLCENILLHIEPGGYPVRLFFLAAGIFMISLGILLILIADIVPQPPEGLLIAVQKKTGWKFSNIKIGFDCTMLLLSVIIAMLFGAGLPGIREGTLISALTIGKTIALLSKLVQKPVARFCYGSDNARNSLE